MKILKTEKVPLFCNCKVSIIHLLKLFAGGIFSLNFVKVKIQKGKIDGLIVSFSFLFFFEKLQWTNASQTFKSGASL